MLRRLLLAAAALALPPPGAADGAGGACGRIDADTDYISGLSLTQIPSVGTVDACCEICTNHLMCQAWTWGLQYPTDQRNSMCYLKTEAPTAAMMLTAHGVYSGLPARAQTSALPPPALVVPTAMEAPQISVGSLDVFPAARTTTASTSAAPTTTTPTTAAPTTTTPTTAAPTTTAPTTAAPTTLAPTTATPTAAAHTTTAGPTTAAAILLPPISVGAPVTPAPTTAAPTTAAPTTAAPTTAATTTTSLTTTSPTTASTTAAPTTAATTTAAAAPAQSATDGNCGKTEPGMDYRSGIELSRKYSVDSAEGCCDACWMAKDCKAWTWGLLRPQDKKPSVCYMKSAAPQPGQKKAVPGLVSGLPARREVFGSIGLMEQCGGRNWNGDGKCGAGLVCVFVNEWYSQCRNDPSEKTSHHAPSAGSAQGTSILCFSVVTPGTFEPDLMVQQWKLNAGLFACDEYSIVSNVTAAVLFPDGVMASQVHVSVIHAQLYSKLQPGLHGNLHALNTPVFIKAWHKLIQEGVYKKYDWLVKLDVDAVLVPVRLKALLKDRPRENGRYAPVYLQNAAMDATGNFLHGPVEVLSQAAFDAYALGADRCEREVDYSREGEDYYLNFCLQLLRVPAVKELQLLQDAYSWGQKEVECTSPQAVFHPAKTVERWVRCVKQVGQDAIKEVPKVGPPNLGLVVKDAMPPRGATRPAAPAARPWAPAPALSAGLLAAGGLAALAALRAWRTAGGSGAMAADASEEVSGLLA